MKLRTAALIAVAASSFALPALAHHSFAIFDQSRVLYATGTVKQLEWINPHLWLHVDIADAAGQMRTWSFEGGATAQLSALGWRPDSVKPGDKVEVGYRPMKDGSRGGQIMNVTFPNGQKVCSNRGCG
jgi:hypothetical protein